MQSAMFVFAGLQNEESPDSLSNLFEQLNKTFSDAELPVAFSRKDRLLTARFDDVNFYISIFNDKKEVKDWYQMAKDFKLAAKPNPINHSDFEKRITKKKSLVPELYKENHYLIANNIYVEIDKLSISELYFFF